MKKNWKALVAVAVAGTGGGVAALLTVLPVAAVTFNVTTTSDTAPGTACTSSCSLRSAVEAATSTGGTITINVPAGTYQLSHGELDLGPASGTTFPTGVTGYNVTVQGAGAGSTIVDQTDGTNRVFNIDGATLGNTSATLSGLTVEGGHDNADTLGGGGILAGSGGVTPADNLTLSSCTVTNNHSGASGQFGRVGGGLEMFGGNVTITNCTFSNNAVVDSLGGGFFYTSDSPAVGTVHISGSTFSGNTQADDTTSGMGGAGIHFDGTTNSVFTVTTSTFTNNVVTATGTGYARGGAIESVQGDLQVTKSTFTGNQANGPADPAAGGAAIWASAGGDSPSNFFAHLNRIVGNTATHGSGGAYAGATLDFTNNWWGCNAGPGNTGCDSTAGSPTTSPRLVLTPTASPSTIRINQTSTVTGSLKINSSGQDTSALLGATLTDGPTMTFSNGTLGSVSPGSASISSASASTTYTAGSTGGLEQVPVTFDNQTSDAAITVDEPPSITSANSSTFLAGTHGSFGVTVRGYPIPTISETGSLPSGVTLVDNHDKTATLSGTPATGTGGVYPITISADNGISPTPATQSFTLTVNEAPFITSANTATFTTGTAGSLTVTSRGYPAPTITMTSGTLPSGVTYDSTTHVLSGTPDAGTGGQYALQFTSHNGIGSDSVQSFTLIVDQPAAITSADSATFVAGTPGSFGVTTTGYPVPTIGETGTLPGGVGLVDHGDGTATLSGTPAAGSGKVYTFSIGAHNGVGTDAAQTFTLTVNEAPSVTSANTTTFTVGTAGTFSVTTQGFPTPTVSDGSATLPSGVTFHDNGNGTATLAGTPAAATGGTYLFTITASNGIGSDATQSFTLVVDQPPAITSANNTTFTVGQAGTFSVTTTGFPTGATMALSESGTLPGGVTFHDNGDGTATLAGTPANGTAADYPITIGASNGVSPDASQNFTLHVLGTPSITSANHTTFVVGQAGTFTVTTTGSHPMTIDDGGATLPVGVTFHDNGDGSATLAGTPDSGAAGTYNFTITASNGILPNATQSFSLQVNEAPAIISVNTTTFTVGTPGSFTVTTTGTPTPAIDDGSATLPSGVSFLDKGDGTATLAGTPGPGTGGTYSFTITAANGVGTPATQHFTLTVDEAPGITSANLTTFTAGTAGTFSVQSTGFPAPSLSDGTAVLPSGVTFHDNTDGTATLAGTPGPGTGGTYTFTITAANGIGTGATQTFTLTVDEAPFITSAPATTFTVGQLGSFGVSTGGYPVNSINETGALPSGVTFTDNHDGTATLGGTPATGSGGVYSLDIKAHNGVGSDADQTFTLTVHEAPTFTSANNATFTVGTAGSFPVTTDAYPTPTLHESGNLPSGVTFHDNGDGTATLSGTAATGSGGVYALSLTASNGIGTDGAQNFTLTVNEAAAVTSTNSTTFTVGTAGSFPVTTRGFPAPSLSDGGATLPSGVTFVDNHDGTASLSGTPAAGTGGAYGFTITAHNAVAPDATQSFTLIVDEAASITSGGAATFTTGQAGSFPVTTYGFPKPTLSDGGATLPGGVTFIDNHDGTATLSGTPNAGTGASYSFTITASNGVGPDGTQHFTLTVDQPAAITSASSTTLTAGSPGSLSVTTNGYPAPSLSDGSATLPGGVTFVDNHNGTATLGGTPATGSGGVYHFTITAHNGIGSDATQSFTLTVNEAAAITSANTTTFQVNVPGTFKVTTRGYQIPSLMESGSLPSGVTFVDNHNGTATLSGTPAGGTSGSYPLSLTATNGVGSPGTQAFTLIVGAAPTTTGVVATNANPNFGQSDTFTATVAPVAPATGTPQGSVTFSVDGTNTVTVTLVSGKAQWTTSTLQQGAHTIGAAYSGQTNTFKPSSGTTNVNVGCAVMYTGRVAGTLSITGGSACVDVAKISGGISISGGANVSIVNSSIGNGLTSNGAGMVSVCAASLGGSVSITNSTGFVLVGSNNDDTSMPCPGNTIGGGVTLTGNHGGLELGGNPTIKGAVVVSNNVQSGSSVDAENNAPELEGNTIRGSLTCNGNTPAPTNDGSANTVSGGRYGQCSAVRF